MVEYAGTEVRSSNHGVLVTQQFEKLILAPETSSIKNGNYFTALLELPPTQAMQLLTCNVDDDLDIESVPLDCRSVDPTDGSGCEMDKSTVKRKQREKKGKGTSKKSKTTVLEEGEKLPYVHVRARRGQATDSHSLAERVRREKINARMKLLQDLVPGCNKISGTALVLDEIINHVQYLQRQVEYLSMRLAAVNPRIDFSRNSLISGNESMMDCDFPNTARPLPLMWPEIPLNGDSEQFQQQWHAEPLSQRIWIKEEINHNLVAENSLMTYDSPANSASLHSSQRKMEL